MLATMALSLNPAMLRELNTRFIAAKAIDQDVQKARSALQQKEPAIVQKLRSAKVQIDRTRMQFEGIRK
jgi:hypothetical protein